MGMRGPVSRSSFDGPVSPIKGNPNPSNWNLRRHQTVGRFLILELQYPDCLNYEGVKILVFADVTLKELQEQKQIDPHFSKSTTHRSPIARFEPTELGWRMAEVFVHTLSIPVP